MAVEGGHRHADSFGHVAGALARLQQLSCNLGFAWRDGRFTPNHFALRFSSGQRGRGAFFRQIAFDFAQPPENRQEQFARLAGEVDRFRQGPEADAALIEVKYGVDHELHRAPETIELPDNERIASAAQV